MATSIVLNATTKSLDYNLTPNYSIELILQPQVPSANIALSQEGALETSINLAAISEQGKLYLPIFFVGNTGPQGVQGPPGPQGPQGIQGIPGIQGPAGGSFTFVYNQPSASSLWQVQHSMQKYPSVTVQDSAGDEVEGNITYVDQNNLTISFSAPFTGVAYLN